MSEFERLKFVVQELDLLKDVNVEHSGKILGEPKKKTKVQGENNTLS